MTHNGIIAKHNNYIFYSQRDKTKIRFRHRPHMLNSELFLTRANYRLVETLRTFLVETFGKQFILYVCTVRRFASE